MYAYLTGKVAEITPAFLVLDVNGVGFQLLMANPYRYQEGEVKTVYVMQVVRENDISLYGFYTPDEKLLFQKLTSVSGIGAKSALAILAQQDHAGLISAIAGDDVGYLTKFPGVGKKTAQQIVLDLKGKLDVLVDPKRVMGQQTMEMQFETDDPFLNESLEALNALGYSQKEIKRILPKLSEIKATSTDDYLRKGLNLLMKK